MSLVNNTIYSTITFGFRILSGTILMFFFGRFLQVEDFGDFNYAVSFATIMLVIMCYGYNTYIIREISQKRYNIGELLVNTIIPKLIIIVICLVGTFAYIQISKLGAELSKILWILAIGAAFNSLGIYINSIQKGRNLFKIETITSIIQNSLICISSIIAIKLFDINIIILGVIYCISYLIGFVISIVYMIRVYRNEITINYFSVAKNIKFLKEALPFAISAIFMVLYFQIDTLIIGNYLGATNVGSYHSVMKIIFAVMIIPEILFNSFYPAISFALSSKRIDRYAECFKLMKYLMLIAVSISLLTFLFPDIIMQILYNHKYDNAAPILFLFSMVIIVRFAAMGYGIIIVAGRHQHFQLISAITATCLSLILNINLVPKYGLKMAVFNSFFVNLFIFVFYFINIYRIYGISFFSRELLSQTIPIAFIGLFVFFLNSINTYLAFIMGLFLLSVYGINLSKNYVYQSIRSWTKQ